MEWNECTWVLYKHSAWFEPEALLQSAVIYGHAAMVRFLLERGDSCPGVRLDRKSIVQCVVQRLEEYVAMY